RDDLKVRLLEVLAEMRDADGFERQASAFEGSAEVERRLPDLRAQLGLAGAAAAASEPSLDDLEFDLASDLDSKPSKPAAQDDDATPVLDSGDDLDLGAALSDTPGAGQQAKEDKSLGVGGEDTLPLVGSAEGLSLDCDDD